MSGVGMPIASQFQIQLAKRRGQSVWARLLTNSAALTGGCLMLAVVVMALVAPYLPIPDPNALDTPSRLKPFGTVDHILGTDEFGRDMLSRLIWGARISLAAGLIAAGLSLCIGVPLGLISGYYGGLIDNLIMRAIDVVMAFPPILLAIAIVAGLGPGLFNAMIAVAIVGFPLYARLVRGSVLSLREQDFVAAARTVGARENRIILRHVLPNATAPIIVATSLDAGSKIIVTASLSFLGLGTQPPTADWGSMLATGKDFLTLAPHVATLPGLAILLLVLSFNLFGDALRDTLDPRSTRRF